MGIWIRSQDKCKIGKCAEFYIDDSYDGDYDIEWYSIDDTPIILGTYSTEEKAIKVLDMIQEHIETHRNNVFQMPRDIIIIDGDDEAEV